MDTMEKISNVQVGQMMKAAAASLRSLSERNQQLEEKVASYERKGRVEKIASQMEEKNLQPELTFEEKVAGLLKKENLDAVEEAIGMSAPQIKSASVHEDTGMTIEGGESDSAANAFATALASD